MDWLLNEILIMRIWDSVRPSIAWGRFTELLETVYVSFTKFRECLTN